MLEEPFSIHSMAEQLVISFRHRISPSVAFSCEVTEDLPDMLIGDSTRLYQILTNLIGNALKFTQKGFIAASIYPLNQFPDKCKLRFSIKDSGIGMNAEEVARIFNRFEQASGNTERQYGGTGLGLSISKELVALMGGTLQVESEPGLGSHFYFDIILEKANPQSVQQAPETQHMQPLNGLKVLYAEDNEVNRFLAEQIFVDWNTQLDFAENGEIAIEKARSNQYDVILMDVQMPVLDGIEATRQIRRVLNGHSKIPIIGFTADVMEHTRHKALEAGMNDILVKPFNKDELYATLHRYARSSESVA